MTVEDKSLHGKKCKQPDARYTACVTTLGVILMIWCVLLTAFWFAVAVRVGLLARNAPTVRQGLALLADSDDSAARDDETWPKLSIIVPVHNEQRVIEACAASLLNQTYPNLEIILVLDRCTDDTRNLLAAHEHDPRLIIIENDTCPSDWAGKCHAAHLGAQRATGQWLLFTDADTQFDPQLAQAAVALARHQNAPLLSLLSSLTYRAWHERIAQPVATMALMRIFPPTRTRSDKRPRPFANGQFMLFDRAWYEKLGGHTAVKDDLLEDLAFARLIHRDGGQTSVVLAEGMLTCSMYDSLAAFQRGWKRIFIEACRRKPARLRKHAMRLFTLGIIAPVTQIAAVAIAFAVDSPVLGAALILAVLAGWIAQAAALILVYTLNGAPLWATLGYPIGCAITAQLMREGASDLDTRRPVVWGGREYVLEPR